MTANKNSRMYNTANTSVGTTALEEEILTLLTSNIIINHKYNINYKITNTLIIVLGHQNFSVNK